jgi:hypothetical protein
MEICMSAGKQYKLCNVLITTMLTFHYLHIVDIPDQISRGVRQDGAVSFQILILSNHLFVDDDVRVANGR